MIRLEPYIRWGKGAIRKVRNPKLERLIGVVILVGALCFLAIVLFRSWEEIRPYLSHIDIRLLVIGQLLTIFALLFGGIMWHLIQKSSGLNLTRWGSLSIQFTSGITKYIPGYAWQYLSKAYLSKKNGATGQRIAFAMFTEFILLVAGGIILASLSAWMFGNMWGINLLVPRWGWPLLSGVALGCVCLWILWGKRLKILDLNLADQFQLLVALLVGVLGWILFALASWIIAQSLYPVTLNEFPQFVFALVFSSIVSILVIVVPGGIGIREATLAALLVGALPFSVGVVVSILVRVSVIVAELVAFLLVLVVAKSHFLDSPDLPMYNDSQE